MPTASRKHWTHWQTDHPLRIPHPDRTGDAFPVTDINLYIVYLRINMAEKYKGLMNSYDLPTRGIK